MGIFIKLGWYFKREWKTYSTGVIGLLFTALLGIVPPWIIGRLVDLIHRGQLTVKALVFLLVLLTVVSFAQYLARYVWRTAIWGESAIKQHVNVFWHYMQMDTVFQVPDR